MKQHNEGFLLLELLVYLGLCAAILMMSAYWVTGVYGRTLTLLRQGTHSTSVYAALDLLVRDVRHACADSSAWKKMNTNEYIWTHDGMDIGWSVTKDALIRTYGKYDTARSAWHDAHKSTVARGIASLQLHVHSQERHCSYVQGALTPKDGQKVSLCVALHEARVI